MTQKLIPFDLEKAKAGAAFYALNIDKNTEIIIEEYYFFKTARFDLPQGIVIIEGYPFTVKLDGLWSGTGYNLYMKPVLTERWYNVYKNGKIGGSEIHYKSKAMADGRIRPDKERAYYLKTYWNEEGMPVPELTEWIPVNSKQDQ